MDPHAAVMFQAVCEIVTIAGLWILFFIASILVAFNININNWYRLYIVLLSNVCMVTGSLLLILV